MSFPITNQQCRPAYSTSSSEDSTSSNEDITPNIKDENEYTNICNQAFELAWKHEYLESAKMYFQVFERKTTLDDSLMLKSVIVNYLEQDRYSKTFNLKEINIIKNACTTVLQHINADKDTNWLLKHLDRKTSHLKDSDPNDFEHIFIDINPHCPFF